MIIFVVGLLMILVLRYRDYYHYETQEGGYLEEYEDSVEQEKYEGMIASAGGLHLKAGEYSILIDSTSWGSGNYFEIVDTLYSDGGKIEDKVLFSSKYEKGVARNTYYFSLDEEATGVYIRSYQVDGELSLSEYQLNSEKPYYTDTYFLALLWIVCIGIFFWKFSWFTSGKGKYILVICAVGIIVSLPLFTDFMGDGHDLFYHLQRVNGVAKSMILKDHFPIRVNTAFNYGYGQVNPIMYPELFLYIPGALCALGVSLLISIKFFLVLINLATGIIGFYSIRTVAKERTALAFSIVYMLAPYRLNNLYVRFALGEFLAMTFLPVLFVGIWHVVRGNHKRWWMGVIGCCCVLQAHLLTTEMSILFAIGFVLLNLRFFLKRDRILAALKAIILSVGLNLWYLIPLIQFMGFDFQLVESPRELAENGVYFSQMFSTIYSAENDKVIGSTYHDMVLSVGLTLLIGILAFLLYRKAITEGKDDKEKFLHCCLILGTAAMYMASWLFPWQIIYQSDTLAKLFGIIQFSWRFLVFVTLFFSIITAYVLEWSWDNKRILGYVISICAVYSMVVLTNGYTYENETALKNKFDQAYETYTYTGFYEMDYNIRKLEERKNIVTLSKDADLRINNYIQKGTNLSFDFNLEDKSSGYAMSFPYYNYGFYKVRLNGNEIPTFSDELNLVAIQLPDGIENGHIELKYSERKLYMAGDAATLATLGFIVVWSILKKRNAKWKKTMVIDRTRKIQKWEEKQDL